MLESDIQCQSSPTTLIKEQTIVSFVKAYNSNACKGNSNACKGKSNACKGKSNACKGNSNAYKGKFNACKGKFNACKGNFNACKVNSNACKGKSNACKGNPNAFKCCPDLVIAAYGVYLVLVMREACAEHLPLVSRPRGNHVRRPQVEDADTSVTAAAHHQGSVVVHVASVNAALHCHLVLSLPDKRNVLCCSALEH